MIDPHGQLIEDLLQLSYLHKNKEAVGYFDPQNKKYAPCFNPLYNQIQDENYIDTLASEWSYVLSKVMGNAFSAQMETLLKPAICCILSANGGSLSALQQLFLLPPTNIDFQERISKAPPSVKKFMIEGFHTAGYRTTKTGIITRLQFLQNHATLNQLLNGAPSFDLNQILQQKQCVLFNINSSHLGMEVSTILGRMLIALILSYFFRKQRSKRATYLIIDEASILSDRSLEILLSQSRKRGLFVILATQDIKQFSKTVKEHLQTNVGLTIRSTMDMPNYTNKRYHFAVQYHGNEPIVIKSPKRILRKRNGIRTNKVVVKQLKKFFYHTQAYSQVHEHHNSDNYIRDQPNKNQSKHTGHYTPSMRIFNS